MMKIKRRSELPDPDLVSTLGLPYPLVSDRAAAKCGSYPGHRTTRIIPGPDVNVDSELKDWLEQSYIYSEIK